METKNINNNPLFREAWATLNQYSTQAEKAILNELTPTIETSADDKTVYFQIVGRVFGRATEARKAAKVEARV
jgi:hypothetical protein